MAVSEVQRVSLQNSFFRNSNLTTLFSKTCKKHGTPHTQCMIPDVFFHVSRGTSTERGKTNGRVGTRDLEQDNRRHRETNVSKHITTPTNQPTNRSTNHRANQSTSEPINSSTNPSTNHPLNQTHKATNTQTDADTQQHKNTQPETQTCNRGDRQKIVYTSRFVRVILAQGPC